jgi:type III pantothenate kinase
MIAKRTRARSTSRPTNRSGKRTLLVFDVGNSETTVGLYAGTVLEHHWRLTTDVDRTPDEMALLIRQLLDSRGLRLSAVNGAALGSVVPSVTGPLAEACRTCFGSAPVIVDASAPLPIRLAVDEPLTVGADRLINTLAASRIYERDTIVVDLGTATTYDCITKDGVFLGGVIAPGVRTSAETLFRRTAKLPATELRAPEKVIGTRTEDCIRAGVMFGAAGAVDGIIRRIVDAWPRPERPLVVATGGLAETVKPLCETLDVVAPYLTLEGLRIAADLLSGSVRRGARRVR